MGKILIVEIAENEEVRYHQMGKAIMKIKSYANIDKTA